MIIYCAGPIRGDVKYRKWLREIIEHVAGEGHIALSELSDNFKSAMPLTDNQIFKRDIKWLEKSKAVIAEISGASTGVGFEISYALYKQQIPVLALANDKAENASAMIEGCNSKLLTFKKYSGADDLKSIVSEFIKANSEG